MKLFFKAVGIIILGLLAFSFFGMWWMYIYLECGKFAHGFC